MARLDPLIHAPARLRICAALDPVREVEFGALLTLLGISGSTYLVSKGIQFSTPEGTADRPPRVTVQPKEVDTRGLQHPITQQFTVMFDRGSDQRVVWTIDSTPVLGSITPTGVYTGPAQAPAPGTKVVIKAASVADCRATGYAEVLF